MTDTPSAADALNVRFIMHCGDVVRDTSTPCGYKTINEHWIVNGVKFWSRPTEEQIEEAYSRAKFGKFEGLGPDTP